MTTTATVLNIYGDVLAEGLQPASRCDEALRAAKRHAEDEDEEVILIDSDGDWFIHPDGYRQEMYTDDWWELGLTPPTDDDEDA